MNCVAVEGVGMASHGEGQFVGKRSVERITCNVVELGQCTTCRNWRVLIVVRCERHVES